MIKATLYLSILQGLILIAKFNQLHQIFQLSYFFKSHYQINLKDIGEIYKIRIVHDNSGEDPRWKKKRREKRRRGKGKEGEEVGGKEEREGKEEEEKKRKRRKKKKRKKKKEEGGGGEEKEVPGNLYSIYLCGFYQLRKATNNKNQIQTLPSSENRRQKVLKTETQDINAMPVADA
ncbi:hypothetical protein STEG23_026149 [Scotinomys teguina]